MAVSLGYGLVETNRILKKVIFGGVTEIHVWWRGSISENWTMVNYWLERWELFVAWWGELGRAYWTQVRCWPTYGL